MKSFNRILNQRSSYQAGGAPYAALALINQKPIPAMGISTVLASVLAISLAVFYSQMSLASVGSTSQELTALTALTTTESKADKSNMIKQGNVCRLVRSQAINRSTAQQQAKEQALDNGVSRYQQRIYRTRVGSLTRPSLRDLSRDHC